MSSSASAFRVLLVPDPSTAGCPQIAAGSPQPWAQQLLQPGGLRLGSAAGAASLGLAWGCSLQTRPARRSRGLLSSIAWEEAESFGRCWVESGAQRQPAPGFISQQQLLMGHRRGTAKPPQTLLLSLPRAAPSALHPCPGALHPCSAGRQLSSPFPLPNTLLSLSFPSSRLSRECSPSTRCLHHL